MNYNAAAFALACGTPGQLPPARGPEIAFCGRSNVGKSSLIDGLCRQKALARVSATPGKTATINFYSVQDAFLVDLPGYGYAKVSAAERRRWDALIERYFSSGRRLALLVQLVDGRRPPTPDDEQMMEYLRYHGIPFAVALTKCDKLKKSELAQALADAQRICGAYGCRQVVPTSAKSGLGMEPLRALLDEALSALPGAGAPPAKS